MRDVNWGKHRNRVSSFWKAIEGCSIGPIDRVAIEAKKALDRGNKILTCGNGGSACEASHFVGELVGRFSIERPAFPALCLNDNGGVLTCISNDYSFEDIFARQLEAHCKDGDMFFVFSTSGNSKNIITALKYAKENFNIKTVGMLGNKGGECLELVDYPILVPSYDTALIQEVHLSIVHFICTFIDINYEKK